MHKVLKTVRNGRYANVLTFDKLGNPIKRQLHHNRLRRKFYLSDDIRGLFRTSITSREALRLVLRTLWLIRK
jgi:hypothetical protein